MVAQEPFVRSGGVRATLLGLVGFVAAASLAAGLAIGRWRPEPRTTERGWQDVDELHLLYPAPSGYNFLETSKEHERLLIALLHDQLLHYDPVQNALAPGLARRFETSPDGLTWTFHLRAAHTPDGVALTAEDVVFSFNLCLDTRFDCKQRGNFLLDKKPITARAIAPLTVAFSLPRPFPSFPWALSRIFIVPKSAFAAVSQSEKPFRQAVGAAQPAMKYLRGFGPYWIDSQDAQVVRLVRNERFWGRGDEQAPRPYLRQLTMELRKAPPLSQMDFLRDEQFVYREVGAKEAERLREDARFQLLDRGPSGWCLVFWVNQNPRAPWAKSQPGQMTLFRNFAFRRALAQAIDRRALIRRVFKGRAEPLYGPVSPVYRWAASPEVLEEVTPKTDLAAARGALAKLDVVPGEPDAAGKRWLTYEENGKRMPLEIEIRTSSDEQDRLRETAEELKTQLEAIGVRIKVVEERFDEILARLDRTYDYEAAVIFFNGTPDPASLKFLFESSGPVHFFHPYQPAPATAWEKRVDQLFRRFAALPDAGERNQALLEMQKTWTAAQPAVYLLNERKVVAVRRDCEVNGLALTGRANEPVLERTVIENVRLRRLLAR